MRECSSRAQVSMWVVTGGTIGGGQSLSRRRMELAKEGKLYTEEHCQFF